MLKFLQKEASLLQKPWVSHTLVFLLGAILVFGLSGVSGNLNTDLFQGRFSPIFTGESATDFDILSEKIEREANLIGRKMVSLNDMLLDELRGTTTSLEASLGNEIRRTSRMQLNELSGPTSHLVTDAEFNDAYRQIIAEISSPTRALHSYINSRANWVVARVDAVRNEILASSSTLVNDTEFEALQTQVDTLEELLRILVDRE